MVRWKRGGVGLWEAWTSGSTTCRRGSVVEENGRRRLGEEKGLVRREGGTLFKAIIALIAPHAQGRLALRPEQANGGDESPDLS